MGPVLRENLTWEELEPGRSAELSRLCTEDDLFVFASATGNHNPMHLPDEDGDGDGAPEAVIPGLWVAAMISAVLGSLLPGAGTLYRRQTLDFVGRAMLGDRLTARVTVTSREAGGLVRLATEVVKDDGSPVVTGEAVVQAPPRKLVRPDHDLPGLTVERHVHFDRLIARAATHEALATAVVAPEEPVALEGALMAAAAGLIRPILVGDPARIAAAAGGADLSGIEIVPALTHAEAAAAAVALVREGRARALMKGHLHTDVLLSAVVRHEGGLRMGRRLSHVFVMDVPGLHHPLLVTDAAINVAPTLEDKVDIVQNAIDLARAIGIDQPKVGVLSAVETVNPKIPSSVDAAILSKMAERGQITGGLVDGPLAMDNAVDIGAARTKGIRSAVAGQAEVLVVPGIDSGNMLAKELTFLTHAEAAGLAVGARVPVILTSRADEAKARLASCALAVLWNART